jgi:hypothetical protein
VGVVKLSRVKAGGRHVGARELNFQLYMRFILDIKGTMWFSGTSNVSCLFFLNYIYMYLSIYRYSEY